MFMLLLLRNEPRTRNRIEICTERKYEISGRLWKNMFKWLSRTQAFVMSSIFGCYVLNFE
ncbi:hypothetical protein HanPI659440_Chr09g0316521 [Helianthus annuus]|nr:hypothetical protein HanPI659440_Chr09g0316521 [Helianthus annuus]